MLLLLLENIVLFNLRCSAALKIKLSSVIKTNLKIIYYLQTLKKGSLSNISINFLFIIYT